MKLLFLVVLFAMLSACSLHDMQMNMSTPQERAFAEQTIKKIQIKDSNWIFSHSCGNIDRNSLSGLIAQLSDILPADANAQSNFVDLHVYGYIGGHPYREAVLGYEMVGSDKRSLAELDVRSSGTKQTLCGAHIFPLTSPSENLWWPSLANDPIWKIVIVIICLAVWVPTLLALRLLWHWRGGWKKWALICVSFFGVFQIGFNWDQANVYFTPISIGFPPSGAAKSGLLDPWLFHIYLPVFAIIILLKRRKFGPQAPLGLR